MVVEVVKIRCMPHRPVAGVRQPFPPLCVDGHPADQPRRAEESTVTVREGGIERGGEQRVNADSQRT